MFKSHRNRNKKAEKTVRSKHPISNKFAKAGEKMPALEKEIAGISNGPKSPRTRGQGEAAAFTRQRTSNHSGELSGDLQGLPEIERLDSENLVELVEEGNAFEANVLTGVEDAEDNEGREVHTHEVPEDDVPGEYLDQD